MLERKEQSKIMKWSQVEEIGDRVSGVVVGIAFVYFLIVLALYAAS